MICPNLKDPKVKEQFQKLIDAIGEPMAYFVWNKNGGNYLDKTSTGKDSVLWKNLSKDNSEEEVIKLKSKMFSSNFKATKAPIEKVKYDWNKPASEQSRAARDNAKLDITRGILTSPDTFSKLMNPQSFQPLKDFANPDIKGSIAQLKGISKEEMDIALPSTNREMFIRNMTGKALIGVFVNQAVNHAILQYTDVTFSSPIELDGDSRTALNEVKNVNGNFISRTLGMFVGAAADNAKDPVASELNISLFTADILTSILRVGYPLETALYFLNQPSIVELADEYILAGADPSNYNDIFDKIKTKYTGGTKIDSKNLTKDLLKNDISGGQDEGFKGRQMAALMLFDDIRTKSFDLGKLINMLRPDNMSRKISSASNEVYITNVNDLKTSQQLDGLDTVWDKYPMMKSFYENAVVKVTEELNRLFPWNKTMLLNTKKVIKNNFPANKRLNENNINFINLELLNFLATNFEFFNGSDREYIVKKFPEDFKKAINEKYPELKSNPLISRLRVVNKKITNIPVDTVDLSGLGLTEQDKVKVIQAWAELLDSDKYGKLAENLVKYTYYSHGFVINPKTFSYLIPVEFYTKLKDSDGQTFNKFLINTVESLEGNGEFSNFVDQFYRNNWENSQFVPSIDENAKGISVENNTPITVKLNENTHRNLVTKPATDNTRAEFVNYLTVNYKGTKYLFMNDGYGSYSRVEPLGLRNVVKEYNLNESGLRSMFSENHVSKKATTIVTEKLVQKSIEVFKRYYEGNIIPDKNTIFVFGSNPEGRHGAGAAKIARERFGAKYGQGEGLQGNSYALPTKDLRVKENKGFKSISPEQITESIKKLYEIAKQSPNKQFKIAYRNTTQTSLNGYTGIEMIDMFNKAGEIPLNIIFSKEWFDTGRLNLGTITNISTEYFGEIDPQDINKLPDCF